MKKIKIVKQIGSKHFLLSLTLILGFVSISSAQYNISYSYDAQGRLLTEQFDDVYLMTYEYDVEGNLQSGTLSDTSGLSIIVAQNHSLMMITPNPTNGEFSIHYNFLPDEPAEYFYVYDMRGKLLRQFAIPGFQGKLKLNLNLPPGQYILKADNQCSEKLVIF